MHMLRFTEALFSVARNACGDADVFTLVHPTEQILEDLGSSRNTFPADWTFDPQRRWAFLVVPLLDLVQVVGFVFPTPGPKNAQPIVMLSESSRGRSGMWMTLTTGCVASGIVERSRHLAGTIAHRIAELCVFPGAQPGVDGHLHGKDVDVCLVVWLVCRLQLLDHVGRERLDWRSDVRQGPNYSWRIPRPILSAGLAWLGWWLGVWICETGSAPHGPPLCKQRTPSGQQEKAFSVQMSTLWPC